MTILEIFEKVNLVAPIEQRRFFNYFADSIDELLSLYGGYTADFVLEKNAQYSPPEGLCDDNPVLPLYHNSIVDNILFLSLKDQSYKLEFIRKSRLAFLTYWNKNAKGRRVKRMRW